MSLKSNSLITWRNLQFFFKGTKRHAAFVKIQRHHYLNSQPLELKKSGNTRRTSRSQQVQKLRNTNVSSVSFKINSDKKFIILI